MGKMMKNNENEIITLTGENGEELDFILGAEIEYDGFNYLVLKPLDKSLGLLDDEALVFRIEPKPDGDYYELEVNDEVIDAVAEIYNNL